MMSIIPEQLRRSLWLGGLMLLATSSFGLTGCEEEAAPPEEAKEAEKEKPEEAQKDAKAAPIGDEGEEERLAYSYNPIGKRDPFRTFIVGPTPGGSPEFQPGPLQKFEIDQYKLKGIIWGITDPVAMVEDPEGMGHFLSKDTLIGKNWGKVVRISPQEVIVAEEYRDFEGKLIVNEIPLKLPAEKE